MWDRARQFVRSKWRQVLPAALLATSPFWKWAWSAVQTMSAMDFLYKRLSEIPRQATGEFISSYGEWLAMLAGFVWLAWLLRDRSSPEPEASAESERANPESFERFRELWNRAKRPAQFIQECLSSRCLDLHARDGIKRVAAELLQPQNATLRSALTTLGARTKEGGTIGDLEELKSLFNTFLKLYHNISRWWFYIETDLHAENQSDFLGSKEYEQFHKRHEGFCAELERLRDRSDFKDVVPDTDYFSPGGIPAPRCSRG